jgi:O-antigen/teichoic acid export membrane protein
MEENSKISKSPGTPVEITQSNPELNEMEANEKEDINLFFKKTLRNTLSAFFLSMISAVINFFVNIPLLRKVSKESYGIVKVYFELAFTLVNFIPRETIRRACQKFCPDRDPVKEKKKFNTVSQMNYLFFFCFAIISVFVFFSFMLFTDSDRLHENYIQLLIYILCGLLELAIEPVIMYMNLHMENKFLPITISSISRVVTNSFFVSVFGMDLWGFTLSRVIGSVVYFTYIFCLGAFRYKLDFTKFFPTNIRYLVCGREIMNETNILYLREILLQFVKLNLLNLILSRCQNVVLSFVVKSTDEEKSDYSFISQNYGLITRFLLEPIIDAFYNLVNKIKHIEPKNNKYMNEESDGKISPEGSMNLNIENNKIQMEEGETKDKSESDNNMIPEENSQENKKEKETKKEINYDLTIKLLQLFIKIFTYVGVLMIPYYLLIGTEIMGVIYGKRWENNTIDKIGDCFSYYVVVEAVCNLIKNYGNATNDTHQMNLSYLSLIVNAVILYLLMYLLSKWDICGLIVSNEFSSVFLINFNLYIIFCGKAKNVLVNVLEKSSLFSEVNHFIKKCFITKKSIVITTLSLVAGHAAKKVFLVEYPVSIKILSVIVIGAVNVILLYLFERRRFTEDLNIIKSYKL